MPYIQSQQFGEIEYSESAVFHFPSGLPGFDAARDFVFLQQPNTHPLMFMHSLTDASLSFILLPILALDPDYRLELSAEDSAVLQLPADTAPRIGTDVLCAAVVCAGSDQGGPSANLLAPIVLNLRERIGMQVIQSESGYSHRHPIFAPEEVLVCS